MTREEIIQMIMARGYTREEAERAAIARENAGGTWRPRTAEEKREARKAAADIAIGAASQNWTKVAGGAYKGYQATKGNVQEMKARKGGEDLNSRESVRAGSPLYQTESPVFLKRTDMAIHTSPWSPTGYAGRKIVPFVMNKMFHTSTKDIQKFRMANLLAQKVQGYEDLLKYGDERKGVAQASYDVAAPDFVGFDPKTNVWINKKYAQSGDVADLKPYDITGSPLMFELFGDEYLGKWDEKQRYDMAQLLLEKGLIDPEKGGFLVTDEEQAKQIAADYLAGKLTDFESTYEATKAIPTDAEMATQVAGGASGVPSNGPHITLKIGGDGNDNKRMMAGMLSSYAQEKAEELQTKQDPRAKVLAMFGRKKNVG